MGRDKNGCNLSKGHLLLRFGALAAIPYCGAPCCTPKLRQLMLSPRRIAAGSGPVLCLLYPGLPLKNKMVLFGLSLEARLPGYGWREPAH